MQDIEPFYNWRHLYCAEDDDESPFFEREYSEFEYNQTLYNYYIHPQWDDFGSSTLYMKILFLDYEQGFTIIELFGEWNDAVENDIMTLRREITDILYKQGIKKYIFIGENVFNFHSSDDLYYEEWAEQLEDDNGWVVILNLPEQSKYDFLHARLHHYVTLQEIVHWRTFMPDNLYIQVENTLQKRLE